MTAAQEENELVAKTQNQQLSVVGVEPELFETPTNKARAPNPRYSAEKEVLHHAIEGDLNAAKTIIQYLDSAHPDLRQIMQTVLHESIDFRIWRILLNCLATGTWVDYQRILSDHAYKQRSELGKESSAKNMVQSIAEAYVLDETEAEKSAKEQVLLGALRIQHKPLTRVRHASAWILGLRGDLRVVPVLEEMIDGIGQPDDLDWALRAVEALAALNDERCGPPLVKALSKDRGELHRHARLALDEMGGLVESAWLVALRHPNSHVRWHAARALGQLGDPRAVEVLAQGLYDENHAVRWATADVLARLDAPAIPAILKTLAAHPLDEQYRQVVYHALHAMPAPQTQEYLQPLMQALQGTSARVEAPCVAQRMLSEWKPIEIRAFE